MKHYDADAVTRFAHDESSPGTEEFREHIAVCTECASDFRTAQELELTLRDEMTWQLADAADRTVTPPDWLVEREAKRARERAEVEAKLEPVLVSPAAFKKASLENVPEFHSSTVVQVLTEAAETLRTSQPKFALSVADTAVAIGTKLVLGDSGISRTIVGRAWCQRASALLTLSRYREADEAATRAQKEFDADPASTPHDTAIVYLSRAILYVETERVTLAETLARDAARIFQEYGDDTLLMYALLIEGNALYMRKEYERGAVVLERLAVAARERKKWRTLAHALHNIGWCFAGRGEWAQAEAYYFEALVFWDEIGDETERTRTNWALAFLMLNTDRIDSAIPRLRDVWRRFEALGVVNDAALARMDLAEALVATGEPAEVPALLDGLAVTFASEGMTQNAKLALAYLKEALAGAGVTARLIPVIRHVRMYLDTLPTDSGRPFVRPN